MELAFPSKAIYVALWFGLFVVPRILQRWRIPAAITAFGIGLVAGPLLGLIGRDPVVDLLATVGIVSLFLFAGLDIEPSDFRRGTRVILEHLAIRIAGLGLVAWGLAELLDFTWRPAALLALAVLTPSTGFILDSLEGWKLTPEQNHWVRTKAIASEILGLVALFAILQSTTPEGMLKSMAIMAAMIFGLPHVFKLFARIVLPYAPRTEFAFLMMTAMACALVTRELGVYYLVGAFVVGLTAQRLRRELPAMASERMLHSIESFGTLFIPFYFFHAAASLPQEALSWRGLLWGLGLVAIALPLRVGLIAAHRRWRLGENWIASRSVALPLMPTLVFCLVLARILTEQFQLAPHYLGALVVYAIVTTLFPSIALRTPAAEFGPETDGGGADFADAKGQFLR